MTNTPRISYDFSKLLGKIVEKYGKQESFAPALGISSRSLSLKVNNERYFKPNEISRAVDLLGLDPSDIPAYFFTAKVQENVLLAEGA